MPGPKKQFPYQLRVRVSNEVEKALKHLAQSKEMSISDFVRILLNEVAAKTMKENTNE